MGKTVAAQYFIDQYKRDPDPWRYETSVYEHRKYQATLDALPRRRYRNALELACSIGVFTSMLAQRCDRVLAVDVSPEALAHAQRNCAAHSHVRFTTCTLPRQYPRGCFDLTTVCEVGYYLGMADLRVLRENVVRACIPEGHVVLVHWMPSVKGHATSTDQVHETFAASPQLIRLVGLTDETYRIDVFERRLPNRALACGTHTRF